MDPLPSPSPTLIKGVTPRWSRPEAFVLLAALMAGGAFRLYRLAADGFADDEVHKWLAAVRYLHGDFGGDDVEHPMLMKSLIALCAALFPTGTSPEFLTRLPNVIAGVVTVWVVAQLGRRLFGKVAGLTGAVVYAVSVTAIGYGRIAKEDTLLGLFLLVLLWCFAEAFAAARGGRVQAQHRWEVYGALALGGMFASKYFVFLFPIPLLCYLSLRKEGGWILSLRRWAVLISAALALFLALNWVVLLPATWDYMHHYIAGDHLGDRASSETYLFMGKLYNNLGFHYRDGTPSWFHLVFAAVKLAPPTAVLAFSGIVLALVRRHPAHRIVLITLGWFALAFAVASAKYGRYFIPLIPLFVLLAAHAAVTLSASAGRLFSSKAVARPCFWLLAALLVSTELAAAVRHAPEERLYISALGGGDSKVDFFFPHCDYFDAGVREAMAWVTANAEHGAEVASEVVWVVQYYADQAARKDLLAEPISRESACRKGGPCYVIVQPGRLYGHNQAALERLAPDVPAHEVQVAGRPAVRVYRVSPGDALFP